MVKKRLTQGEEFEILKLVLDKFLWLGTAMFVIGLYNIYTTAVQQGILFITTGIVIFVIFIALIIKEYELLK